VVQLLALSMIKRTNLYEKLTIQKKLIKIKDKIFFFFATIYSIGCVLQDKSIHYCKKNPQAPDGEKFTA
jgi:hypothetical protein